jgi:hypothetical protein
VPPGGGIKVAISKVAISLREMKSKRKNVAMG